MADYKKDIHTDALVIAETANMSHEQWLEMRYDSIGGSEASTVAGINKWNSPYRLYLEKRKLITPKEVGEAAEWGNILEPIIRKHFATKINEERAEKGLPPLKVQQRNAILAHKTFEYLRTNLDGLIFGHELGTGILEIKTSSAYLDDEWKGEDVPDAYMLQVQHNLMVTGLLFAFIAVLIGGNTYKHYFIPRDEDMINDLMQIEHNFWNNHVLAGVAPPVDGHNATKEALREQYPNSTEYNPGEVVQLPNKAKGNVVAIELAKEAIAELEEYKTRHENELKAMIGDQETVYADKHKITWKVAKNGNRPLRIKLEATDHVAACREKFAKNIAGKIKEIEKATDGLEKEARANRKEYDKTVKDEKKAAEKALKDAKKACEKRLKDSEKASKKAFDDAMKEAAKLRKEAEKLAKKAETPATIAEFVVIEKTMLDQMIGGQN